MTCLYSILLFSLVNLSFSLDSNQLISAKISGVESDGEILVSNLEAIHVTVQVSHIEKGFWGKNVIIKVRELHPIGSEQTEGTVIEDSRIKIAGVAQSIDVEKAEGRFEFNVWILPDSVNQEKMKTELLNSLPELSEEKRGIIASWNIFDLFGIFQNGLGQYSIEVSLKNNSSMIANRITIQDKGGITAELVEAITKHNK